MFSYRIAQNEQEIQQAVDLVSEVYIAEGYFSSDQINTKIQSYLLQPYATTILAFYNSQVIGAISLIRNTDTGLPMDDIFSTELVPIRKQYQTIAEICQFAIEKSTSEDRKKSMQVSFGLLAHTIHVLRSEQITGACFTINPKHLVFYTSIGCEQIGDEKQYALVNNAPALALFMDISKLSEESGNGSSFIKKILSLQPDQSFLRAQS